MRRKIQRPKSLPTPIFIGAKRGTFEESESLNIGTESEVQMAKNHYKSGVMFDGASLDIRNGEGSEEEYDVCGKSSLVSFKTKSWKFKFRWQHPIGIYIVDFYSHKVKLVIELDGNFHNSSEAKANDEIRQKILEGGIKVIRVTKEEIFNELDMVVQKIQSHLITQ